VHRRPHRSRTGEGPCRIVGIGCEPASDAHGARPARRRRPQPALGERGSREGLDERREHTVAGDRAPSFEAIHDVDTLDELLSTPTPKLVDTVSRLEGDLLVLGVAGKMGPTLAWMARRAFDAAGLPKRQVFGVARFSEP